MLVSNTNKSKHKQKYYDKNNNDNNKKQCCKSSLPIFYIIKLFGHVYINLYVSYSWPNGWTKLADIF